MTPIGRPDSREDVLQTSVQSSERGHPSPSYFLLFEKHLIVILTQPFSKWLKKLPACHYGEVDQSARVNTLPLGKLLSMEQGVGFSKHLLYFFIFYRNPSLCQGWLHEHWKTRATKWLTWRSMTTSSHSWRWMMIKSLTQKCRTVQQKGTQFF